MARFQLVILPYALIFSTLMFLNPTLLYAEVSQSQKLGVIGNEQLREISGATQYLSRQQQLNAIQNMLKRAELNASFQDLKSATPSKPAQSVQNSAQSDELAPVLKAYVDALTSNILAQHTAATGMSDRLSAGAIQISGKNVQINLKAIHIKQVDLDLNMQGMYQFTDKALGLPNIFLGATPYP